MANRMQNLLFLLVLTTGAFIASGHVALTFPPARQYDLDFLDNSRTPAPCGMPKGESTKIYLFTIAFKDSDKTASDPLGN